MEEAINDLDFVEKELLVTTPINMRAVNGPREIGAKWVESSLGHAGKSPARLGRYTRFIRGKCHLSPWL